METERRRVQRFWYFFVTSGSHFMFPHLSDEVGEDGGQRLPGFSVGSHQSHVEVGVGGEEAYDLPHQHNHQEKCQVGATEGNA